MKSKYFNKCLLLWKGREDDKKLSNSKDVIENLKIFQDDFTIDSDFFEFKKFANQITNFLLDQIETPFCIGLDGEWGSGKTSLLRQVYKNLQELITKKEQKLKLVWFDSWAYERFDPVISLMYVISKEFHYDKKKSFKEIVEKMTPVFNVVNSVPTIMGAAAGIPIPAINFGLDKIIENFQSKDEGTQQPVFTITQELTNMTKNEKLIVFVDDLDRCSVNNVLDILEAIKLFLSAPNVIFIIAADMKKLERIWMLRYGPTKSSLYEGREHIEKILQLKLSLPPKDISDIDNYLTQYLQINLPEKEKRLFVDGCPYNPRKIKRILNLIYFIAKGNTDDNFEILFPIIILWSIITVSYPELAELLKITPGALIQLSFIAAKMNNYEFLLLNQQLIEKIDIQSARANQSPTQLDLNNLEKISIKSFMGSTVKGLSYMIEDYNKFRLFKAIGKYYNFDLDFSKESYFESLSSQEKWIKDLDHVIHKAGLIAWDKN